MDLDQVQLKSEFMEIRRRFKRLERRYRRVQWALAGLVVLTTAAALFNLLRVPNIQGELLDARGVVLRDRFGRVMAELRASDELAELALYGARGSARLIVRDDRSMVVLDNNGQRKVVETP